MRPRLTYRNSTGWYRDNNHSQRTSGRFGASAVMQSGLRILSYQTSDLRAASVTRWYFAVSEGGAVTEARRQCGLMIAGEQKDVRMHGGHGLARRLEAISRYRIRRVGCEDPAHMDLHGIWQGRHCIRNRRASTRKRLHCVPGRVVHDLRCGGRPQSLRVLRYANRGGLGGSPARLDTQCEVVSSSKP